MSNIPGLILPPGVEAPSPADDPLVPPEDMAAKVIAEFERREAATAAPANEGMGVLTGDGPPGGFPDINDAAAKVTARVDLSQHVQPGEQQTPPAQPPAEGGGQGAADPSGGGPAAPTSPQVPAGTAAVVPPSPEVPSPEGGDPAVTPPPVGGYTWSEGNESVRFTDDQVQRALSLEAWASNLAPEVVTQFGMIETGQAVAVPRADFDEWQAWKAQQGRVSRDADLERLDIDPQVAEILRKQRDEIDALKSQAPTPGVDPQTQAYVNNGAQGTAQEMNAAMQTYATSRGLDMAEVEGLLGAAVASQVIPSLVEANAITSPTGMVIRPANMAEVTEQALDWALVRNPHLRSRVLAGQQPPNGQVVQGAQLPPTPSNAADAAVQARKARAGSVASASGGAPPPPPPRHVAAMSPQEVTAAMAADIEAAMKA